MDSLPAAARLHKPVATAAVTTATVTTAVKALALATILGLTAALIAPATTAIATTQAGDAPQESAEPASTEPSFRGEADQDRTHLVAQLAEHEMSAADRVAPVVERFDGHTRQLPRSQALSASVPTAVADQVRAALLAHPDVTMVEEDAFVETTSTADSDDDAEVNPARSPNDPRFNDQWALPNISASGAWNTTVGSSSVSIAVLDTGVDAGHGDLSANIGRGHDVVGDGDGTDDVHGHGTKAAGVAAATTNNSAGVAGVCWQCEIWPVKVLADNGGGRHSDVAEGVRWAADQGADVITLSLGGHGRTRVLEAAVTDAVEAGTVVIASAGNYGTSDPVYPAAYDDVVGVAALDRNDQRTSYSSYGSWVTVAAPGCTITTITGGGYNQFCGTSSAAPHVAGLAGLAASVDGTATPATVRAAIADGADAVGQNVGSGRINADATLSHLRAGGGNTGDDSGSDGSDGSDDSSDGSSDGSGDNDDELVLDSLQRIVGNDRFATAAALSAEHVDPGGDRVYLATGQHFADALAAGAAAGSQSAPVLLAARSQLPSATADELARLEPGEVVVVGGDGVVAEEVVTAAGLAADAPVRRVAGGDRFETAAEIATSSFSGPLGVAYLATGEGFADALAGVPAAVVEDAPMLLTGRDNLPKATRDALRELGPRRVVILGGEDAVSPRVRRQLLTTTPIANVQRLAGSNRFATAAAISDAVFDADSVEEVALATGHAFPDALAAGPIAGANHNPLLLVGRDQLPTASREALRRANPSHAWLLGGPDAIGEAVVGAVRTTTR